MCGCLNNSKITNKQRGTKLNKQDLYSFTTEGESYEKSRQIKINRKGKYTTNWIMTNKLFCILFYKAQLMQTSFK